jgi:hypothetical protein
MFLKDFRIWNGRLTPIPPPMAGGEWVMFAGDLKIGLMAANADDSPNGKYHLEDRHTVTVYADGRVEMHWDEILQLKGLNDEHEISADAAGVRSFGSRADRADRGGKRSDDS